VDDDDHDDRDSDEDHLQDDEEMSGEGEEQSDGDEQESPPKSSETVVVEAEATLAETVGSIVKTRERAGDFSFARRPKTTDGNGQGHEGGERFASLRMASQEDDRKRLRELFDKISA